MTAITGLFINCWCGLVKTAVSNLVYGIVGGGLCGTIVGGGGGACLREISQIVISIGNVIGSI